ncbi:MAG: FAD-binding protein, partial [Phycisphaerales bacterium]|nr:FAD-binding protein [Phycisphaerales bacterium]
MTWCSGLEAFCRADVPLRDFTWYQLGGPARWFVTPRDAAELRLALNRLRDAGVAWRVLGRGANVLVRDTGFDGAVIHLSSEHFARVQYEGESLLAGAGADFTKLVKQTCNRGLGGLESLAGIPGLLGGIVRMNAGGKYGDVSQVVREVEIMDATGEMRVLPKSEVQFEYRRTNLAGQIVIGARLDLHERNPAELVER